MRRLCIVVTASLGFLAALNGVSSVRGDFPDMLNRVPGDANVLMVMDLDRVLASPLAKKKGWKEKRAGDYSSRPLSFPPQVTKLVRAAHVDLEVHEPKWQVAILEAGKIPPLETIAKNMKGYVDTVAYTKAVWSPRGWYGYMVGDRALGVMFPANRQYLSRWIKEPSGRSSPYLQQAAGDVRPSGPQLLLAVDLEDIVQPQQLEERLKQRESLKGVKNISDIARTVASVIGVRFTVTIGDKATGTLTVDFSSDTAPLKDVAKPLLLESLGHAGLYLEDLESWTASVSSKAVTLKGDLSHSGLMRLSSLLELPDPPLDDSGRDEATQVDATNPKLYATQSYFKSIQTLLDDVLQKKADATSFGQMANWIDMYTKRIDRLPTLNVDEDMQKYSMDVVELLRQASTSFRGVGIRTGAETAQTYAYGGYNYNGFRTGYDVAAQRNAVQAQERATGATQGRDLRVQIDDETTKIRRLMTERYKVNF